jgi:hypothetical protein
VRSPPSPKRRPHPPQQNIMTKITKTINWCRFNPDGSGIEESYGSAEVTTLAEVEGAIALIPAGASPMFFIENREVSLTLLKANIQDHAGCLALMRKLDAAKA